MVDMIQKGLNWSRPSSTKYLSSEYFYRILHKKIIELQLLYVLCFHIVVLLYILSSCSLFGLQKNLQRSTPRAKKKCITIFGWFLKYTRTKYFKKIMEIAVLTTSHNQMYLNCIKNYRLKQRDSDYLRWPVSRW